MYLPATFRNKDLSLLHKLIQAYPLGTLISGSGAELSATFIPFLLYPEEGTFGTLRAHVARANPHWQALAAASACLILFQGEHGYITPSWYPGKRTTHKVVPPGTIRSWKYAAMLASSKTTFGCIGKFQI